MISDFIKDVIGEPTDIIATGKSTAAVVMAAKLKEESIDRMIFINPADLDDLASIPDQFNKAKKALFTCPVLGTFIYHVMHRKNRIIDFFMRDYFYGFDEDYAELIEYYHEACHKDQSGSKYLYASLQGGSLNLNIKHGVKVLDKDIIIISGSEHLESDYVPEEYAILNDNIECITIMDTAYLPQLEAPGKVMDIISEYWK